MVFSHAILGLFPVAGYEQGVALHDMTARPPVVWHFPADHLPFEVAPRLVWSLHVRLLRCASVNVSLHGKGWRGWGVATCVSLLEELSAVFLYVVGLVAVLVSQHSVVHVHICMYIMLFGPDVRRRLNVHMTLYGY